MISYLNTLEVLSAGNDRQSQMDINKKIYTFSEMMNELVAVKGILVTANIDTNMAEVFSSKPKSKCKGGRKKDFTKQEGKQVALGVANKGKKKARDYTKGKYFHCGEKGHWKRNCPKFIADKNNGMMRLFLLETCLVHNPTDSWCVDSRCTNHIYNVWKGFQEE